jgi:AcrR family transcriptional regulator
VSETKRRRGAELERAILDVVWTELRDVGYAGLTMERVAARAGTSKPVLYRRWANRAELVLAAWSSRVPQAQGSPDTGALRTDLLELFTRIAKRADSMMSEMIAGVMGEAFRHPEVLALLQEQLRSSRLWELVELIVRRAVDRGELAEFTLPQRVVRLPLDLIRSESMMHQTPITAETIAELVDDVYLPLLRGLAGNGLPVNVARREQQTNST